MLVPNTVYLYSFQLSDLPSVKTYPLSSYESKKLQRLSLKKKQQYQQTRYIIRDILALHHIAHSDLNFSSQGRPLLKNGYSIALTHSADQWIIALMKSVKLGIDLQIPVPKNLPKLLARCNLPLQTTLPEFLSHWTLIESYCKYEQKPLISTLSTPIIQQIQKAGLYTLQLNTPNLLSVVSSEEIIHHVLHDGKMLLIR